MFLLSVCTLSPTHGPFAKDYVFSSNKSYVPNILRKPILQLIPLSFSNKYLIKSSNAEIRSQEKDNENCYVWGRSSLKARGSSHLLSAPYPLITLVPRSARGSIRHLSHAFPSKCAGIVCFPRARH